MSIITISRGTFSGGEELAKLLGERLGYEVVSREVLAEAAVKYGVSESKLAEAMRKAPGLWDRFLYDRRRYLAFVQCALCDLASHDRIVYHGHAGHLLLTGVRHVLRVRLIAPLEYRLRQVERRQGIGRAEAQTYVARVDHDREKWTQWLYGVNWHHPELYDLVVNLEHLDLEAACASIAAIVSRPQFEPDEASRQAFADLHLASRVRAALAADPGTAYADVEVRASGNRVEIEGKLPDPRWVQAVLDTTRRVEGVGEVRYGTRVMLIGEGN
jgi:cytidylate kinase